MKHKIPDDFLIGTSSSAWQVEGNGGKKGYQKSWADLFYETDPRLWYEGTGPQKASDFYHRYREDIATMAKFGMRAFRFTIQWPRFMDDPVAGTVSPEAVAYYRDVIRTIREYGMEPIVSLEHWDIPAVLFDKYDGWVGRETLELYRKYVAAVLAEYHDEVKYWFAFTEPNIPIDNGYMDGIWYPFRHDPKAAYQAHFHKTLATAYAVKEIEKYRSFGCKMGVMIHLTPIYARSDSPEDKKAAYYADLFQVRIYLDPYLKGAYPEDFITELKKHDLMFSYQDGDMERIRDYRIDLLGVDYYFPIRVKAKEKPFEGKVFHPEFYYDKYVMPDRRFNPDRGWEIYPQALQDFGKRLQDEYGNFPWIIAENGIGIMNEGRYRNKKGYIEDDYRIEFIRDHLRSALQAREDGADCRGYLIWSFVDNVSARNAFKNRYGLLELNLDTYERIPKKSLYWMKEILDKEEV